MEERRKNRKVLSKADEAFLQRIRVLYKSHAGGNKKMRVTQLRSILGIRDGYLARRIFSQFSPDGRTTISEESFLKTVIDLVLSSDTKKLDFIFRLHDTNNDGSISRPELVRMLDASLRQNQIVVSPQERKRLAGSLFRAADQDRNRRISLAEFKTLLRRFPEVRKEMVQSISSWFGADEQGNDRKSARRSNPFRIAYRFLFHVLPQYALKYIWVLLYVAANAFLFYRAQQQYAQAGANVYIQIARGAGACLNLNGALILVPMMRTLLSAIRRTPFHWLLPLDQNVEIHRVVGEVMFLFALLHTGAHLFNYSTLSVPIPASLFGTAAGLSGVVLLGIFLLMWIFSRTRTRRKGRFELFYYTHLLYLGWFAAFLVHGRSFWKWALIPLIGFGVELVYKQLLRRNLSYIADAKVLPAGVTALSLHRPPGFTFQAGDYVFLRIPSISRFEWHPFTISSGPEDESALRVHVRSLGDWTRNLHKTMSGLKKGQRNIPAVFMGPYGTPSNRIFRSKNVVLVGAGIGVTPFASILQSIAHQAQSGEKMTLEKVYFFWLNRGQRSFEWFSELLERLEQLNLKKLLEIHIYMTDAKINAVTGLAKIGMELRRKQTRKDLTTGLQSRTNFGRPDWDAIFAGISKKHGSGSLNVFFCGPTPLARSVHQAATRFGFRFRKENF